MGRRWNEAEQPDTTRWILTYTDLCTLLLTFFVLLVSMSTIDGRRERKALDSLVGSFGPMPGGRSIAGQHKGSDGVDKRLSTAAGRTIDLQMLRDLNVRNSLDAEQVQAERNKTLLQINHKILFRPGSTELNPEILSYLGAVAGYIREKKDEIEIRGHTDLFEGINQSNWSEDSWSLSLKRAQSVYNFFRLQGIDVNRMSCRGYSYYKPRVNSQEFPQQGERNQRVEIVLGPNDHIPTHVVHVDGKGAHGFNYKNFFFRLFPDPQNGTDPIDGEKPDIYDLPKEKKGQ